MGGSHDPLLEWALRESSSGLASLPEGSEEGLRRLTRGEVMIAAIHLHRLDGDDETANLDSVAGKRRDCTMPSCSARTARAGYSRRTRQSAGLERHGLDRNFPRADGAASHRGRRAIAAARAIGAPGIALDDLKLAKPAFPTGPDIAQAIRAGRIDCGIATRSVAKSAGLDFLPPPGNVSTSCCGSATTLWKDRRRCSTSCARPPRATGRPNSADMMSATPALCGS